MGSLMLQQQPQNRASHLPLIALVCTVVLAAALPIAAATAGPAGSTAVGEAAVPSTESTSAQSARGPVAPRGERGSGGSTDVAEGRRSGRGTHAADGAGLVSSCGPELTSPEGLTAQACVLSEEHETWARAYYRNETNSPLRGALTLTRPDGSSLRADCEVAAAGDPGMCETPREKSRQGALPEADGEGLRYSAMTEVGSLDGERLLLRSGSNSPAGGAS